MPRLWMAQTSRGASGRMKGNGQLAGRSAQLHPTSRCPGPLRAPQTPQPPLLAALLTVIFSKANEASIFAVRSLMLSNSQASPGEKLGFHFFCSGSLGTDRRAAQKAESQGQQHWAQNSLRLRTGWQCLCTGSHVTLQGRAR